MTARLDQVPDRRRSGLLLRLSLSAALLWSGVAYGLAPTFSDGLSVGSAAAQGVPGFVDPNPDAQMFLEADELIYDDAANQVTAVGRVTIFYDGYTVEADEVVYDRAQGRVLARGNVILVEPNGSVLRGRSADLSDTLLDGFVDALSVETPDQTFFTARRATRRNGEVTVFEEGTYTACTACEDDPDRPRAWMFHADRITYDEGERMVYYDNVRLDFFGIPVIWLPFFAHADPTVERQSGFLRPVPTYDDELGVGVSVPYYIVLSPSYDVTITPTVYTNQGLHLEGEWRQRLETGEYSIRASGIHQFNPDAFDRQPGDQRWRGGLASNGAFRLNSRWNAGWNLFLQSDRRYFRDYALEDAADADEIVSDVFLTGLHDRSFFDARVQRIEVTTIDANGTLDSQDQAWSLPVVDYDRRFSPDLFGGELQVSGNLSTTVRQDEYIDVLTIGGAATNSYEGFDGQYARATMEANWRRTFIGPMGQVFTPHFGFRGDAIGYNLDATATAAGFDSNDDTRFRGMATASLEWRWPFLITAYGSTHVVEPIAQIIARPNASSVGQVPIEDSQSLVFDASNLFDLDKFSGYDQIEGGTRANVGARYVGTFQNGLTLSAIVGQSFHLAGENPYATNQTLIYNEPDSGLETDRSDYVAMVSARLQDRLALSASGRFDEKDFTLERGEIIAAAAHGPLSVSTTYAYLAERPDAGVQDDQHQISGTAAWQVNNGWRVAGSVQYDLEETQLLGFGAGISYVCDCFGIGLNYTYVAAEANDGISDNRLMLNISLRTIGGVETEVLDNDRFNNVFGDSN
ncbi:MAG: LPS-assembly protein LptD [Pseudomonadota bacterium]